MDMPLWVSSGQRSPLGEGTIEASLTELDQDEVGRDHDDEKREERGWERREAEYVAQRGERQPSSSAVRAVLHVLVWSRSLATGWGRRRWPRRSD
jgi:hypothetical protein